MDFKLLISLLLLLFAYARNSNENHHRCNSWTKLHNKASQPSCPNGKKYYAVWNTHNKSYINDCFDFRMVPKGHMLIIDQQSGHLNSVDCPEETIQPQPYLSYTECGCDKIKSRCNEQGQAIFSNGSTYEDRLCRCDYTSGYGFVTIPAGKCFCNPKTEKCTCRRQCCENGYKLSQDYTCIKEKEFGVKKFTCPKLSERIHQKNTSIPPIESDETGNVLVWKIILTVALPTAIISGFIFFVIGVAVENKKNVCEQLSRLFNSKKNNSKEYELHPKGQSVSTQTSLVTQEYLEDKDVSLKKQNINPNNAQFPKVSNQGNGCNDCGIKTSPVISTSSNFEGTTEGQSVSVARGTLLPDDRLKKVDPKKQKTDSRNVLKPRAFEFMESKVPLLKEDEHGFNEHEHGEN
ncbi:uncharacterized protein LOC127737688 [Mytilus californianus]|uniref:uncharacterized protein LOC127737688 n=1 Tax=Mytilus californianus TaxID=6549 RepID=UPI0022477BD9|nr:uncharacterized protein LOC127737688 [Mytilus californianus]XP_052104507.1 uncharacterized protein LOC127737688 [Mytilus californianus]